MTNLHNQEEQKIRAEIADIKDRMQAIAAQTGKQASILSNGSASGYLSALDPEHTADRLRQVRALEYQKNALYEKQESFNERFNAFAREVGEFPVIPPEAIAGQYGEEIASIWKGFEIDDPYSMCMAFLSLLDRGSDLPWCYFPSVTLQSCYISMLPWTRTRFIPCCDDIWEHYDAETGNIVSGPSNLPLSKKIKTPEPDNWYRMQYHDAANSKADNRDLFSLSHILYEVTGCLMPRNPRRHLAALSTLKRYGINSKKENQNLLYCMALLGEAKHQSQLSAFPALQESGFETLPDSVDALRDQVVTLTEALSQCRQALQDVTNNSSAGADQIAQLQRQLAHRDFLLHDLSSMVFDCQMPTAPHGAGFPYRTACVFAVFSTDEVWIRDMRQKLPNILFFHQMPKENSEILRTADTIWIQPKDMAYDEYRHIIAHARKADVPVRVFPFTDAASCATLLVQADLSR
jgi:regulator of extracellular matrix RemA (YlzA/DUF370 family)